MTEQEYINVCDKERLSIAISALRGIVPENSKIINKEELKSIFATICKWRDEHFETITIDGEE